MPTFSLVLSVAPFPVCCGKWVFRHPAHQVMEEAGDRIGEGMSGRNHSYCLSHCSEGFQGIEAASKLHPVVPREPTHSGCCYLAMP